ncbi:uncharacterized protein LOC116598400 [Mustela erminea]|uniref:uncharacterized protein LOC116598400 n=1 Tax=Mustela erminea TaxID=36723 RepID=UPI0013865F50|nr:uncharacterized protein LOC116598400 [Mustela erminea]XP_032213046.1 uncharacterized protein LOC116598400 [Mustela erminea]XP_032213048.1 uncharacterized protein LOC116598400 [Mustela erminea]
MRGRHRAVLIPQISCLRSHWKCRALPQTGRILRSSQSFAGFQSHFAPENPLVGVWSLSQSPITVANSVNLCCGPTSGARASYKVQRDLVPAFQKQRRELSVILDSPQYLCSLDPRFLTGDMWTAAVPTSQDRREDKMKNAHQGGPQGPALEEAQETADIPVPHGAKGWGKLTLPASPSTRRRPYQWVTVTMETNKFLHITGERPPASSPGLWGRQKAACSRKLTFLFSTVWLYMVEQRAGVPGLQWDPSSATLAAGEETARKCGTKSHTHPHTLKARLPLSCDIFF